MENTNPLTFEDIISKTNELLAEIEKYLSAQQELKRQPKLMKWFFNKSKKMLEMKAAILKPIPRIKELWTEYQTIELPEHLKSKYGKWFGAAKAYYRVINEQIDAHLSVVAFTKRSNWDQIKNINELLEIDELMKFLGNESIIVAQRFNDARNDLQNVQWIK